MTEVQKIWKHVKCSTSMSVDLGALRMFGWSKEIKQ